LVTAWLTKELGLIPCRGRIQIPDPTRQGNTSFHEGVKQPQHEAVHAFSTYFAAIFIALICSVYESSLIIGMWLKTKQTTAKNSCDYFEKK